VVKEATALEFAASQWACAQLDNSEPSQQVREDTVQYLQTGNTEADDKTGQQ
jgi:hypothetical protein